MLLGESLDDIDGPLDESLVPVRTALGEVETDELEACCKVLDVDDDDDELGEPHAVVVERELTLRECDAVAVTLTEGDVETEPDPVVDASADNVNEGGAEVVAVLSLVADADAD